jgi:Flp pilus assembly pilin Flp
MSVAPATMSEVRVEVDTGQEWIPVKKGWQSMDLLRRLGCDEKGQDIAEYAVMLAVILVIVVGTVRLIGSNANNVFSQVASSIQ